MSGPYITFATDLSLAARKMRNLFDAFVRERGLTLSRARALLHLSRAGRLNQSELAEAMDIEQPSVVRLLDGLEKQGLIRRVALSSDKRVKQIELTEFAASHVSELEEITASVRTTLLEGIDPEKLAIATEVLQAVARNTGVALTQAKEGD